MADGSTSRGETRSATGPGGEAGATVALRLYLAPGAPNSTRALSNLQAICEEYLQGRYTLELVDVRKEPRRALADGVLVTPALVRVAPGPRVKVVGNLSQREQVLQALGLAGTRREGPDGIR